MSNYKNIKRNSTRPRASQMPYKASIGGRVHQDRDIRQAKAIAQFNAKLESWKNL